VIDGKTDDASVALGTNFADGNGHIAGYFSYRSVDPVVPVQPRLHACTVQNATATALQCGGSSSSPPATPTSKLAACR